MKRSLIANLGVTLVSSVQLLGCAAETGTEECLPGDKDCADTSAGGKSDQWDSENDPRYFASNLEYKLSALPKKGFLDKPVWKERYPTALPQTPVARPQSSAISASGRISIGSFSLPLGENPRKCYELFRFGNNGND